MISAMKAQKPFIGLHFLSHPSSAGAGHGRCGAGAGGGGGGDNDGTSALVVLVECVCVRLGPYHGGSNVHAFIESMKVISQTSVEQKPTSEPGDRSLPGKMRRLGQDMYSLWC